MPVTTKQYKETLSQFASIEDIEKKSYRIKIFEILKTLIEYENSSKDFEPFHWFNDRYKEQRKFARLSPEQRSKQVGRQFFYAVKEWLQHTGYMRERYKITEKGHTAFLFLEACISPPVKTDVELAIFGEKDLAKLAIKKEGEESVENLEFLISPQILTLTTALVSELVMSGFDDSEYCLSIKNLGKRVKVAGLLRILIAVKDRIISEALATKSGKEREALESSEEWIGEAYTRKWNDLIRQGFQKYRPNRQSCIEKNYKRIPHEVRTYVRPGMIKLICEDSVVRQWIDKQLNMNPDFFMPHILWVRLGFKRRQSLRNAIRAAPVSVESIVSYSRLEAAIVDLGSALEIVSTSEKDELKECYQFLTKSDYINSREFYDAWRVLRRTYANKLQDLSSILDAALERHLLGNENPIIDLPEVFSDFYEKRKTLEKIGQEVRKGKYDKE